MTDLLWAEVTLAPLSTYDEAERALDVLDADTAKGAWRRVRRVRWFLSWDEVAEASDARCGHQRETFVSAGPLSAVVDVETGDVWLNVVTPPDRVLFEMAAALRSLTHPDEWDDVDRELDILLYQEEIRS